MDKSCEWTIHKIESMYDESYWSHLMGYKLPFENLLFSPTLPGIQKSQEKLHLNH
jgi:hypothetical protein